MKCERLKRLVKNWYSQVQDEAMAPARMVDFMRKHVDDCIACLADPIVEMEVSRITEIVLPPSKIPKAVRREEEKDNDPDQVDKEEQEEEEQEQGEETEDDDLDPDDDDDEI